MDTPPIRTDIDGPIARLTLCRPETANVVDLPFAKALNAAAQEVVATPGVRAVILQAEGKVFCGGGDLKGFAAWDGDLPAHVDEIVREAHAGLWTLLTAAPPVIAAVGGSAGGMGLSLVAASDIVIASEKAKFVAGYAAAGLTPDGGLTHFLPEAIGRRRAAQMMLLNQPLGAAEARDWGLVTEVVTPDALQARADEVAGTLAAGATGAFRRIKQLLVAGAAGDLPAQLKQERASIVAAVGSEEGVEGITAFTEKRPPDFSKT